LFDRILLKFRTADQLLIAWDAWRLAIVALALLGLALVAWNVTRKRTSRRAALVALAAAASLIAAVAARPGSAYAIVFVVASLVAAAGCFATRLFGPGQRHSFFTLVAAFTFAFAGILASGFHVAWKHLADQRTEVLEEMRRRPGEIWPRGGGHTTLSGFAVPVEERGWMEAGGSFSPGLKSFGISFHVRGPDGRRVASSDDIDIGRIRHVYRRSADGTAAIMVSTPFYVATWTVAGSNGFTLEIQSQSDAQSRLDLVVRSVGPAGGPVTEIERGQGRLQVNNRWMLTLPDNATVVGLGDERESRVSPSEGPVPAVVRDPDGWAFAQIALPQGRVVVNVVDTARPKQSAAPLPVPDGCALSGFPAEFADMVAAHQTTLLLGIVGAETRPGDPVNYPLSWQRDGAYELVALARCGYSETARRLAEKFATDDFFGGFGAEADAPGLAAWSLGEVATALSDPKFDAWLWPHMQRKAELIRTMLDATGDVRRPFVGPVVPKLMRQPDLDLVARRASRGLIEGRMDWHTPIFYVNAASYLGLVEAAELSARVGVEEATMRWTRQATELKQAYRRLMSTLPGDDPESMNPRTTINALYPTDIADPALVTKILDSQWSAERNSDGSFRSRPLWTYFSLAQAHQWLRLKRVDRVLATQAWFEANDVLPGLRIFWEGSGEENSFGLWKHVRGHLKPLGVTPHYWSSAEALMLALEMLVFFDRQQNRIVIGGGLPRDWLAKPLRVGRIGTPIGPVSWSWDGKDHILVDSPADVQIELGEPFPAIVTVDRRISPSRSSAP